MKVFSAPESAAEEWDNDPVVIARLHAAREAGKRYLIVSTSDQKDMVRWILHSFASPLAVVPLDPSLPSADRERILAQLPAHECVHYSALPAPSTNPPQTKDPEAIWAVIFSSGSTGTPKGVALSGNALRASAEAHGQHLGRLSWLLNLPTYHVGGFSVVSRAHFLGTPIALGGNRFDADCTLDWLRSERVEAVSLVPTTLRRLLAGTPRDLRCKVALVGGAPAEQPLVEEAKKAGIPIHLTYGCTENASQVATERRPGEGMRALPGVELKIIDGEIFLKSPFLASGIFRDGRLESLPLRNGFFATGDLGDLHNETLTISGRNSDLIISGGVKIFPVEIENALADCPDLEDAAACGLDHSEWGQIVGLAFVGSQISPDTVKSHLAKRIDSRKVPKRIVRVPSIPRTNSGKVKRAELAVLIRDKI